MTPLGEAVLVSVPITGSYALSKGEATLIVVWIAFAVIVTVLAFLFEGGEKK